MQVVAVILLGVLAMSIWGIWEAKKCPKCKRGWSLIPDERDENRMICRECGHLVEDIKSWQEPDHPALKALNALSVMRKKS